MLRKQERVSEMSTPYPPPTPSRIHVKKIYKYLLGNQNLSNQMPF